MLLDLLIRVFYNQCSGHYLPCLQRRLLERSTTSRRKSGLVKSFSYFTGLIADPIVYEGDDLSRL